MLFRKRIPKDCSYCKHAAKFNNDNFLCAKKGIISGNKPCRKFKYDPCKRIPPKPKAVDFQQYESDDFSL